jgi:hypothetical protein
MAKIKMTANMNRLCPKSGNTHEIFRDMVRKNPSTILLVVAVGIEHDSDEEICSLKCDDFP